MGTTYRGIYDDEVIDNYDYIQREEKFNNLIEDDDQEVYVCIIESIHCHDFKFYKCGVVAVDGGHDYLRRCGELDDYEELSVTDNIEAD